VVFKKGKKSNSKPLGKNYWRLWFAHGVSNLGDGVSQVAYPWLASAVTRSPLLIASVAVASRLPWLVFTLPAGVITDRFDRRKIIIAMDITRAALALLVAVAVTFEVDNLPALNTVGSGIDLATNWFLYTVLVVTALLFGCAEVLRDNSAQTLMPDVVEADQLESANGKLWSLEFITNSFIGPPLGSFLIGLLVFLPFYFDAATFFVSAALIATLATTARPVKVVDEKKSLNFKAEIKEGFAWLWKHDLLRPMAIILGSLNALGAITAATFILFAQEILNTSVFIFAILGTAGAVGGTIGGVLGPKISAKFGSGPSLYLTLLSTPVISLSIGLNTSWQVFWVLSAVGTCFAVLWNVITVSLRQSIIPSHLLGRVNSVYRFFAWGSLPIGTLIGGALVDLVELGADRQFALRLPYFLVAVAGLLLFFFAAPRLTTEKIEAARAAGK
jgi:MFS family permease